MLKYVSFILEAKHLLKKVVEGVIPNEIIHRKKMGFAAPMAEWLRGDFGKRAEEEILGSNVLRDFGFNRDYLKSLLQDHQRNRAFYRGGKRGTR